MRRSISAGLVLAGAVLLVTGAGQAQNAAKDTTHSQRKATIYVMPNALAGPSNDGSQVIAESSHNGQEPQVAKIYHELQQSKSCQSFSENMIKDKADYFLLLQHGGGRGNRWAASDRDGNVIASGESYKLGTSVNDACAAIEKHWQQRQDVSSAKGSDQEARR